MHEAELEAGGSSEASLAEIKGARARKRIDKLLWDIAKQVPADEKVRNSFFFRTYCTVHYTITSPYVITLNLTFSVIN